MVVFHFLLLLLVAGAETHVKGAETHLPNIFIASPMGGSHFIFMLEIAHTLSLHGMNVTLLTMDPDPRVPLPRSPLLTVISPSNTSLDTNTLVEECVAACIDLPTWSVMTETVKVPSCNQVIAGMYQNSLEYFTGTEWEVVSRDTHFDMIIAEERMIWAAALVVQDTVPLVMVNPELSYILPKIRNRLPFFFSSEPEVSTIVDFQNNFGTLAKVWGSLAALGLLPFAQQLEALFSPHLAARDVPSLHALTEEIDLFLVNDFHSLSFPYLLPRSVLQLGTLGYSTTSPSLPHHVTQFLDDHPDRKTVYLSFGSHVGEVGGGLNEVLLEKWVMFIAATQRLHLNLIISTGRHVQSDNISRLMGNLSDNSSVLVSPWLPQKSLLRSGKIHFFVSHCGNNARLEAVYFKVPVLCVPLFAEQPLIAHVIKYRGFGDLLLKETLSVDTATSSLSSLVEKEEEYRSNLEEAVDFLEARPATLEDELLHHIKHLLKYKNLDFLENKVSKDKTLWDSNNIDIQMGVFVLVNFTLCVAVHLLVKCFTGVFNFKAFWKPPKSRHDLSCVEDNHENRFLRFK